MEHINSKLMEQLNSVDREALSKVLQKFNSNIGFTLGKGNTYEQTILIPKLDELEIYVKENYPEHYQSFSKVRNAYLESFKSMYSEESKAANREL